MAKKPQRLKNKEETEFNPFDELFLMLSRKIDKVPVGRGKSLAITWGVVSVILIAVASILFHFKWVGTWVPALIGAPAGVILYMIGLGLVKRTDIGNWSLFEMKQTYSFKQRLKKIIFWFGLYVIVFIPLGKYIPYGLGGAILIVLVMTSLAVARRTPQELLWAKQGVPDPRDLSEDDDDDYTEEEASQETTEEADKIYYDEQRGGFGGKLK